MGSEWKPTPPPPILPCALLLLLSLAGMAAILGAGLWAVLS